MVTDFLLFSLKVDGKESDLWFLWFYGLKNYGIYGSII